MIAVAATGGLPVIGMSSLVWVIAQDAGICYGNKARQQSRESSPFSFLATEYCVVCDVHTCIVFMYHVTTLSTKYVFNLVLKKTLEVKTLVVHNHNIPDKVE
jgi:hypothetical protein